MKISGSSSARGRYSDAPLRISKFGSLARNDSRSCSLAQEMSRRRRVGFGSLARDDLGRVAQEVSRFGF